MSTTAVVLEALNQQINAELGASYEYLAMSAWCTSQNLLGTAKWLRLQSQEEYGHAMKLFDFVLDRGGKVSLKAMAAPVQEYASLHDVFERVSKQEQAVSGQRPHRLAAHQPKNASSQRAPDRRSPTCDAYGFVTRTFGTATFAESLRTSTLGTVTVAVSLTMSTSGVLIVVVSVLTSTLGVCTWNSFSPVFLHAATAVSAAIARVIAVFRTVGLQLSANAQL